MKARNWTPIDDTLNDSFPASDPPAWNAGRQKTRDARAGNQAPLVTNKTLNKPAEKAKPVDNRIRIGPSDV